MNPNSSGWPNHWESHPDDVCMANTVDLQPTFSHRDGATKFEPKSSGRLSYWQYLTRMIYDQCSSKSLGRHAMQPTWMTYRDFIKSLHPDDIRPTLKLSLWDGRFQIFTHNSQWPFSASVVPRIPNHTKTTLVNLSRLISGKPSAELMVIVSTESYMSRGPFINMNLLLERR